MRLLRGSITRFSTRLFATERWTLSNEVRRDETSKLVPTRARNYNEATQLRRPQVGRTPASGEAMIRYASRLCSFVVVVTFGLAIPLIAQPPAPSIETLRKDFANPPIESRPIVRWWWFGA